jgi:hypothetical protein
MAANMKSQPANLRTPVRVLLKALLLFVIFNGVFALLTPQPDPLPGIGRVSAYNVLFAGRERLPYGDHPERAYNVSVLNLDALFAAHELAGRAKAADEYRVLLVGDSSTWGWLLRPGETLAAQINRAGLRAADGRRIRAYNLGYPIMSLAKDVLVIDRAMHTEYQPDAIVWLVTLESFPADKQLFHPLLQTNPAATRGLIERYGLKLDANDPRFSPVPSFLERTLLGEARRRELADLLRLQLYGVLWAATGIDQDYPDNYERAAIDLDAAPSFHSLQPPTLREQDLSLDALQAGLRAASSTPLLLVNEPILVSNGKNSDVRYNFFYPHWAYDQYRALLSAQAAAQGWHYADVWNLLPMQAFTNSAVHYTPDGARQLADALAAPLVQLSKINAR